MADLIKQLGAGFQVVTAPSGSFVRIRRKADGGTLAWAIPLKRGGVRLHLLADVGAVDPALLEGMWEGTGKRPQLRVTEENVDQGKRLLAALAKDAPPKSAATESGDAKARRPAPPRRGHVVEKRRVRFRVKDTGEVRSEDIPKVEAAAFVKSLKAEGHEVPSDKQTSKR